MEEQEKIEIAKKAVLAGGLTPFEASRGVGVTEDDLVEALIGTGYFVND